MEKNKKTKKIAEKPSNEDKASKTALFGTQSGLMRYKPVPMFKGCKNC